MLDGNNRIRTLDREADEVAVYESENYVCLMKLFPLCRHDHPVPAEDYRRFHLRFYIPREYFNDARKKIDRIIIMTNGLDEFNDYQLYDQLGSRFASLGLPAVLLPLPDHLNRHIRYRLDKPDAKQIKARPSSELLENPTVLYERFGQVKKELAELRRHIRWQTLEDKCKDLKSPCSFYSHFFAPTVRMSYLGYSLGGATMLCDFLESEKELNACFLLNPAINLPAVSGRTMFRQQWEKFIRELKRSIRDYPARDRLFEEILMGQYIDLTPELLQEHGHRLLFIFGGSDNFTNYKNSEVIMPEQWGSGMLILPGIKHFFARNEEWKKWNKLTVKLISDFEENAARLVITQDELTKIEREDDWEFSEEELRERKEELYRASLLKISERMSERAAEKQRMEQDVREKLAEDLQLGALLVADKQITFDELWDALTEQQRTHERIGDILVDVFRLTTREQVEKQALIQRRQKNAA